MNKQFASKALALSATLLVATAPAREASALGVGEVVGGIQAAYSAYEKFFGNQLTLSQATEQVVLAIGSAKAEILSRIDRLAAADGKACAKDAVINFQTIGGMTQSGKEVLAINALSCLTMIESRLEVVEDKASVDNLGFALNALGPILLMTRASAGLAPVSDIPDTIQNSNFLVIDKLRPRCNTVRVGFPEDGEPLQYNTKCAAYNGDNASVFTWTGDPDRLTKMQNVQNNATRNTSRRVAQAANAAVSKL